MAQLVSQKLISQKLAPQNAALQNSASSSVVSLSVTNSDSNSVSPAPKNSSVSPVSHKQLAFIFSGLLLAMFVSSLSETIAATALPTIVGDLGGVEMMQWISTAYILASTIVMPFYGKASDQLGCKKLLMIALTLYAAGKAVCGMASSIWMLILGRCISGLGGGGLMILAMAALSDVVAPRKLGLYMGIMGAVFTASNVLGPVLGGWFVQVPGWRWIFWFTIPLAALAIVFLAFFMPSNLRSKSRLSIDCWGMTASALCITSLVLLGAWGGMVFAWNSPEIIGLIATCLVSGVVFFFAEKRAKQPIMPLWLFKNRNFVLCALTSLLMNLVFMGALSYMPTYLQIADKLSPEAAGVACVPMSIGVLITSTASGAIAAKTGRYKWMLILSSAITAIGFALLAATKLGEAPWLLSMVLFVPGFGIGIAMQLRTLIIQNEFPHEMVGTATASFNLFGQIGSVLGASFIGSLFTSRLTTDLASTLHADNLSVSLLTPHLVDGLSAPVQNIIAIGYTDALIPIFFWFVPLCLITVVLMALVKEHPLATTINHKGAMSAEGIKEISSDGGHGNDDKI